MARIDQETVQRILDAADIVEVVGDFVKLRRSGANYKGLCPFHNERTPSFSVNKARNYCKCFSCGKGGSPVGFIMEHEQLSYNEALRYLARKYNIEIIEKDLSPEEKQAESEREAMLAANEFALAHFKKNLLETDEGRDIALAYFRHRGLNDAMIARFHLGYAIDRGNDFTGTALAAGYKEKYLLATGLAGQSERDGTRRIYDRFRGRVIFPVHTISGRVVAFGARTMKSDKTVAKYVNSPESVVYKKNLELYGLYQAKSAIAKKDKAILVEGYLDVISMHQAGVENVVASSGTSLTEGQIRAIRRFTNNVTLIYDADAAGIKASLRGINMLLSEDFNVKVLLLPPGDDPDSFAQSHSSAEVEEYLATHETDIIAFMTDVLMKGINPSDPTARAKVVNEILATLANVTDQVKRQEYIAQCSRMLNLPEDVIIPQLNIFITKRFEEEEKNARREQARASVQQPAAPQLPPEDLFVDDAPGASGSQNTSPASAQVGQATVAETVPLLDLNRNALRPYEEMLMRYAVRYGMLYIADISQADGTTKPGNVYDLLESEFQLDGIVMTHPAYAKTFDAIRQMRYGGWEADHNRRLGEIEQECVQKMAEERETIRLTARDMNQIQEMEREAAERVEQYRRSAIDDFDSNYCQSRLCNSPDDEVRRTASELLVERYALSRIFNKQGNVESERDQLLHLVPRGVNELRNAILTGIIEDLTARLRVTPADDIDTILSLMQQIADNKAYQAELVKVLGERIILPK